LIILERLITSRTDKELQNQNDEIIEFLRISSCFLSLSISTGFALVLDLQL
jgi:hypothetical protein